MQKLAALLLVFCLCGTYGYMLPGQMGHYGMGPHGIGPGGHGDGIWYGGKSGMIGGHGFGSGSAMIGGVGHGNGMGGGRRRCNCIPPPWGCSSIETDMGRCPCQGSGRWKLCCRKW